MANYGIKISKSNNDVKTALLQNMIMFSAYPFFKLYSTNSGTLTKPSGSNNEQTATIPHNLGYKPFALVFGEYIDENTGNVVSRYKLFSWRDTPGLHLWDRYIFYVDNTNLYIKFIPSTYWTNTQQVIHYFYFIFYEEAI